MSETLLVEDLYVTPEEYLAGERMSESKHEYRIGVVREMPGASWAHSSLSRNILTELHVQLRGKKCKTYGYGMRLRIRRMGLLFYYYPDVTIDCSGSRDDEMEMPTVVFEVLSPSTDQTDRGDKLLNYLALPSMRVYVLVDQFYHAVTVFRRSGESDAWPMEFLGDVKRTLELPEIGCSLPLTAIYADILGRPTILPDGMTGFG